jgi:hypothetical protein
MNTTESGRIISFTEKEAQKAQRIIMITYSTDGTRKAIADEPGFWGC